MFRRHRHLNITIVMAYLCSTLAGCSGDKSNGPMDSDRALDPPESDDIPTEFVLDAELAARYEAWINAMDPFVTQDPEGSYHFNDEAFINEIRQEHPEVVSNLLGEAIQPSRNASIVKELLDGIALANKNHPSQGGSEIQGWACWTYWWGRRCCYWGNDAWAMVAMASAGGAIPVFGFGLVPYAAWAGYLTQVYGGFCINNSWVGGMWLTRP